MGARPPKKYKYSIAGWVFIHLILLFQPLLEIQILRIPVVDYMKQRARVPAEPSSRFGLGRSFQPDQQMSWVSIKPIHVTWVALPDPNSFNPTHFHPHIGVNWCQNLYIIGKQGYVLLFSSLKISPQPWQMQVEPSDHHFMKYYINAIRARSPN